MNLRGRDTSQIPYLSLKNHKTRIGERKRKQEKDIEK